MKMDNESESATIVGNTGCYVKRQVAILFGLLFLSATVAASDYSVPLGSTRDLPVSIFAREKEEVDIRLPKTLKPLHYVVKLQPFINGNFSIMGYVEVEIEVIEPTSNITLHIADIITKNETIKVVPSDNVDGPGVEVKQNLYDNDRNFYIGVLGEELELGKKYILSMEFVGYLNDELRGFYRSTYTDEDGNKRLLASTQFEPTDARRAFPCFDEPAMKATFEIFLARETSMSSISNMPKFETFPFEGEDGWVWDHFNTSVPMSTYLVAFVVSDFTHADSNANDHVLFRVWAREGAIQQADYALRTGPEALTFYEEEYFNIPFPLPKQDMIAIPDFSGGGMENWGLITYSESGFLYDPAVSSASDEQRVMILVTHELAHQWFGNLVTPDWWTDIWLNEGFASFMENICSDHLEPTWKMWEQFVSNDLQDVLEMDSLESSHPISIPVGRPEEINQIFDGISYSKGASVIRMMNYFLTETTFRKGVTNYLNGQAYSNADQDDLWQYLTDAAHEDATLPPDMTVKEVMDTWTLQMGYPVIKVVRSSDGTSATLTQERFLLVKNENSSDTHDYKWWVPLTYTSQDNPNFNNTQTQVWMKDSETEITVSSLPEKDQWVIFNVQEIGYYRVNYDDDNWNLLIQQLNNDHQVIHVINRAQIIDDAMDFAQAGQLSYNIALSVNEYLKSEEEFIAWNTALLNLEYLEMMFSRKGGYGALKRYLLDLLIPLYDSVGFEDNPSDPHLEKYKRVLALSNACHLDYQDCVQNSVSLFQKWMQNPNNNSIVSPNLKSTVYCTAIAAGGEEEWNFGWDQYLASNVGSEKTTLLYALGCTKELWILSRYLDMMFDEASGIRRQDVGYTFSSVAENDVGRDLAWYYLRDQWEIISTYLGTFTTLGDLLLTVTKEFNTREKKHELEVFKMDHADALETAELAVDQAIERTGNNIAWMDHNYDTIVEWLNDHGYASQLSRH
ncbi:aminopeptidase N [Cherax quadricarinatus]|uniref:aminopeptidase N n=1 Tax=Cherax quadricarinatus TaxID=27406 RepID=UPI00387E29F8